MFERSLRSEVKNTKVRKPVARFWAVSDPTPLEISLARISGGPWDLPCRSITASPSSSSECSREAPRSCRWRLASSSFLALFSSDLISQFCCPEKKRESIKRYTIEQVVLSSGLRSHRHDFLSFLTTFGCSFFSPFP